MIKSVKMKQVGHVADVRGLRNACGILVTKAELKRTLGKPRHEWGNNIKMEFKEIVSEDMEWIHLLQDVIHWQAVVNMVMTLWVL
jgi:hypothetical protein